jgi:hypothetical protein
VWERVAYNVSTAVNVAYNEPVLAPVADTVAFTPEVLSQTVAGGILKAAGKVLFAARSFPWGAARLRWRQLLRESKRNKVACNE